MPSYEYKVVPAPKKGLKGKGIRTSDARFANALVVAMNDLGREGWEYQRSETLPCEERSTLGSKSTSYINVLVFRRLLQDDTIHARALAVTSEAQAVADEDVSPSEDAPEEAADETVTETDTKTPPEPKHRLFAHRTNATEETAAKTAPALGAAELASSQERE
jgi:hypothetical protein